MSLPLLLGLCALAVALVGWLAWFAGRRAALREADEELRGVRFQHAAELRKMRRDLVLEREKAKKAEDFSQVIVRARDDDTTRLRRDSAERTKKLEADNAELREVLLLAKQEIDRLRGRVAELDWASTPSRKVSARLAVPGASTPAAAAVEAPPPEAADVEIDVDLSMAEEPSLPGDDSRPSPLPEEPPPAPFDDTAGTVFVTRESRKEMAVALPAQQPAPREPEPPPASVAAVPPEVASPAVPEPSPAKPPVGEETADRERSAEVSRAVEAALAHEVEPPPPPPPPPPAEEPLPMSVALPLEAIRGIGPAVAKALRAAGIDTLEKLAAAGPATVRAALPKRSRDRAEGWVDEAKGILAAELVPVGAAVGGGEASADPPEPSRPAGRKRRRR